MQKLLSRIGCVLLVLVAVAVATQGSQPQRPAAKHTQEQSAIPITLPGSPLGVAWGFLYGYLGQPPVEFMPQLRGLHAGFTKVYLFWNQIEPKRGQYDWSAVDAFAGQLLSPDEGLVSLWTVSTWATERSSIMVPPTPAKNLDDYYRFVYNTVKRCKGRVRYWENDAEANNPVYWGGTKEQFVEELTVFYKAVKAADPQALVVVGYDGLFNVPGTWKFPGQDEGLAFFDYVLQQGRDAFDVFDLRLYVSPYAIPANVRFMRDRMHALGYDKPIISAEYGGPSFFAFAPNLQYTTLNNAFAQSLTAQSGASSDHSGVAALYAKRNTLAPETQMFLQDASPALQAKYQRIQSRELVMRNVLAFSVGVQKTLYWQLSSTLNERDSLMNVMYGQVGLFRAGGEGQLGDRTVTAGAYQVMGSMLWDTHQVERLPVPTRPSIFVFRVERNDRRPVFVAWEQRDSFTGEDQPAREVELPWQPSTAAATDTFGHAVPVRVRGRALHIALTDTPVYIEAGTRQP